ncbi:hypothetical protein PF011_g28186 [Phytophthora fragariae]|uniref:Crinkler effector protein N-terminal domain-containing protein n=1 Tax=Phytophthora fragariae TaxID=53985 RepID=A0A6A3H9A0_9STRA|nr:hypothetical protein PF011_g28186 [Phytophthora fragariae]
MKLACAIVGEGSTFIVEIDANKFVADLKKAIKAENGEITCDPREMELYLAKKGEAWLTENEVRGVSDTNSLKRLDAAREEFDAIGLSEEGVRHEVDKHQVAAGNGPVNVLVVVPAEGGDREGKKVDSGPAFKKARHGAHHYFATAATVLMGRIHDCNCDAIFDVETVVELPFPSLVVPPSSFQVVEGSFEYQARLDLKCLYEKVVAFWFGARRVTVKVAGTIGYGKSHMLAVLVLLLLKNPPKNRFGSVPFVCYIPDCKKLLKDESAVLSILQQHILLNYPDFTEPLDTIEDIRAVMGDEMVILVADQWSSIDECQMTIDRLESCLGCLDSRHLHLCQDPWNVHECQGVA